MCTKPARNITGLTVGSAVGCPSHCLGGDPAYAYAATAPMPDDLDEYLLAGFLRGRPVELVRCLTCDLRVPADCDFVIEGYVDPSEEKAVRVPFGDHTGFYSLEDLYPVFHVTAITRRRDAVYPATIVGVPPRGRLHSEGDRADFSGADPPGDAAEADECGCPGKAWPIT